MSSLLPPAGQSLSLHTEGAARVEARLAEWERTAFGRRLWERDFTLWSPQPLPELADRLGWLELPGAMTADLETLAAFADEMRAEGVQHVVLLGMGGSSLAPEVVQSTFGHAAGWPELIVLDSTHPDAVRAVKARTDVRRTLFIVSSKSGTTTETLSFFRYFWAVTAAAADRPGDHFVAITDPNTPLSREARERGFRRTFLAPPEVGGRYSALSVFGLAPAALIGSDIEGLVRWGQMMADACAASVPAHENPGLALGAALGELALAGRDKLTIFASPSLASLPAWIEQLVAESTGKGGRGIVPVCDEPAAGPTAYATDRVFAYIRLVDDAVGDLDARVDALEAAGHPVIHMWVPQRSALGGEFFRWEVATAAAGAVLGINPFDQPDVQLAKDLAREAMMGEGTTGAQPSGEVAALAVDQFAAPAQTIRDWLSRIRTGDYIGLQAYLAPAAEITNVLTDIRLRLRDRLRVATTAGYGPRFLHSTGQLHKGGPDTGVFLQLVDDPADALAVPETDYSFADLLRAQALGDLRALQQRGRRTLRVVLGRDTGEGLRRLLEVFG